jgi:hypothetical protein
MEHFYIGLVAVELVEVHKLLQIILAVETVELAAAVAVALILVMHQQLLV